MPDGTGTPSEWMDLADALTALRGQLAEAQERALHSPIRLSVEDVTVEFGLELQRSAKADGGLRFGVVSVGGSGERGSVATHRVTGLARSRCGSVVRPAPHTRIAADTDG